MSPEEIHGDVSLVIGVTGHRDVVDEDRVRSQIVAFLQDLKKKYTHTDPLVITGMAEGTDCLAAEAAQSLAIKYYAILPFEKEAYLTTFTTPEARDRARALMLPDRTIELPTLEENKGLDLAAKEHEPARKRQYEELGVFLVGASQILLAVYDTVSTGQQGGTSDIIAFKLGKKPLPGLEECSGLNNAGVGPVHYVVANRKSHAGPRLPIAAKAPDYPAFRLDANEKSYDAIYRLLDEFNRTVKNGDPVKLKVAESRAQLYPDIELARGAHRGMDWTADRYAWANALAKRYQSLAERYWNAVFILLGIGIFAVVPSSSFPKSPASLFLKITYCTAIVIAFALGWTERAKGHRRRYEDYRAFAEALRIQYFWLASGVEKMVAEFYLSKQTGELVWVRDTMSEVLLESARCGEKTRSEAFDQAGIEAARTWVEEQKNFYGARSQKWGRLAEVCSNGSLAAVTTAFLLMAGAEVWLHLGPHFHWWQAPAGPLATHAPLAAIIEQRFHVVSAILIGIAALVRTYGELNNFAQLTRQYEAANRIFSLAGSLLEHDVDATKQPDRKRAHEHAKEVIRDLGKTALQENGDWLIMHRERKLNVHVAVS